MRTVRALWFLVLIASWIAPSTAQNCENYGIPNGSNCSCPTGFGDPTCSSIACGGNIFQGKQRPLASPSSGFSNITSAGCACQSGWVGTGCNVCTTSDACQTALVPMEGGQANGESDPITCNPAPRIHAAGQMSCKVNNPTLQALYPRNLSLNIMRTLQPSLTPSPGVTAFGHAQTLYAQLFYDGVEQFYCAADSCAQEADDSDGRVNWHCQNLHCTCRPGTTFCGGISASDLTAPINSLTDTLDVECAALDASTHTSDCKFKHKTLQSLFGQDGLALDECVFGECVRQSVVQGGDGDLTDVGTNSETNGGFCLRGGIATTLALVITSFGIVLSFAL